MSIQYSMMYKWEDLSDGTYEKFQNRLNALQFELSLYNKLGCGDITMPVYLPESMYTPEMKQKHDEAVIEYRKRQEKLGQLIDLIQANVDFKQKIDDEYLYELWISRIFKLNWLDNPLNDMELLILELSNNKEINPFAIDLSQVIEPPKKEKIITKIINKFKNR